MNSTKLLTVEDYENFEYLYNDFYSKAASEYNFELEPIDYSGFLESVEKGIIECLVLYDSHQIKGFLVYTTAISEAIELNIIHCVEGEFYSVYAQELLNKFLELTKDLRKRKIVCYPMLGRQKSLISMVVNSGFNFVGTEVLRYKFDNEESRERFNRARIVQLPKDYKVVDWDNTYFNDVVKILNETFKNTSDALFDPRFTSITGCRDILQKVVNDVYAKFLPDATSILLYKNSPIGFTFMNMTGSVVNIPLVGLLKEHQQKGLSTIMLKHSMDVILPKEGITEINTTTETDNLQALRLYKNLGFIEDYDYPQAYLTIS